MKLSIGLLCAVLLIVVQVASGALKLPKTSIPIKYQLTYSELSVSGSRRTTGNVKIDIRIVEDTEAIVLNSRELVVNKVKVSEAGAELASTFELQPENEFLVINMISRPLMKNENFTVEIDFNGLMQTNATKGIYRTSYTLDNSTTRYLVATQFAEREARSAFVCYDESEYKASFSLVITCEKAYTVLTVSDGKKVIINDMLATSNFLKGTPLISVDNFGFLISEFEFNTLSGSVVQSFYTKSGDKNSTNFALNNADNFLDELQTYVSYPHGLTTLLHFALPDSSDETSSNYRMIFYNAKDVYGDESSNHVTALKILQTVANAVSHQYFGDLVTHKSKEFSWLTEGFANLFEEILIDAVHPEIRIRDFFNLQKLQHALKFDSTNDTHPLSYEANILLPAIVHHKSASVIRMFKSALGDETFHSALESYFSDNHHAVVESENLYHSFEDAIKTDLGFSFAEAFRTWEAQAGYPVISVTLAKNGRSFVVTQKAFFDEGRASSWYIPLTFTTAAHKEFESVTASDWFTSDRASVVVKAPEDFEAVQWFLFNKQQLGFYRVNYDSANWNALINTLNSEKFEDIHVLNRAQLLDDSLAFATGGHSDFETFFGILMYLERETEYTPWAVAEKFIDNLYSTFGGSEKLKDLVRHLSERFYSHFSLVRAAAEANEIYQRHSKELAVNLACNADNENCINDSLTVLNRFLYEGRDLPEGFEEIVFCNGLKSESAQEQWNATWDLMQSLEIASDKIVLINALACTKDEAVLESYLNTIIGDDVNYTVDDRKAVLSAVLNNPAGIQVVSNLLVEAQMLVLIKLELDMKILPVLVEMASNVKTEQQREAFEAYLNDESVISDDRAIATETFEINLKKQAEPQNIEVFEIVRRIVEELREETTTQETTSTTSETTSELTTTTELTSTTEPLTTTTTTTEAITSSSSTSSQLPTTSSQTIPDSSSSPTTVQPPTSSISSSLSTSTLTPTTSEVRTETQSQTVTQTNTPTTTPTQPTQSQPTTTSQQATSPQPATESTTQGSSAVAVNVILIAFVVPWVSLRN